MNLDGDGFVYGTQVRGSFALDTPKKGDAHISGPLRPEKLIHQLNR